MAPKKPAALIKWDEKFAQYAKAAVEQVKNVGDGIGVKFGRGSITVSGVTVPGGKLECVVLGSCALNKWYEGDYDPSEAVPPDCYAMSEVTADPEMTPHERATSPQCATCADCEKNQFGSAKTGRGKACGNTVRLGLLTSKDCEEADRIASAELAMAGVSPTNVKHWAGYVKMLDEEHGRPPWSVVTEIASYNDEKTQIKLEFKLVELIEDPAMLDVLEKRFLKIQDALQQPYTPRTERPAPKAKAVAKNAKFAGRGRK